MHGVGLGNTEFGGSEMGAGVHWISSSPSDNCEVLYSIGRGRDLVDVYLFSLDDARQRNGLVLLGNIQLSEIKLASLLKV